MSMGNILNDMMEEKLLNMHTAFIGKVVSVSSPDICSVMPLDKIKAYGKAAKSQGVISRVPVMRHVRRYTLVKQSLSVSEGTISPSKHPTKDNEGHLRVEPIKAGDLVLCICCDRNIASSSKGMSTTPPVGHHQLSDAVVVGLLGRWPHE